MDDERMYEREVFLVEKNILSQSNHVIYCNRYLQQLIMYDLKVLVGRKALCLYIFIGDV
jgi:hypothetical protein